GSRARRAPSIRRAHAIARIAQRTHGISTPGALGAGHTLRRAVARPQPRLHGCGGAVTRSRHRRPHRNLQRDQRPSLSLASRRKTPALSGCRHPLSLVTRGSIRTYLLVSAIPDAP